MVYFYGMHKEGGLRGVQKKRVLVMSTLLVAIILLGIGTIAYFRRMVNGNITGQAGNLVLIVNEANAVDNETFTITLKRSEEENFIMPDDKGTFDLNIDATGSTSDVTVTAVLSRVNLPNNLRFYLDENYEEELSTNSWVIEKADTMIKTVPIYWYWDGSIDDENDSDFINTEITANISVSASISKTLYDTLMSFDKTVDTDVDFNLISSETNGVGLMLKNETQNDEHPILYYRGDVANNNVVYAGYCWLIVRTTETGGIKLLYNGELNSDGSCTNHSGVDEQGWSYDELATSINRTSSAFNENSASPVYSGYMYNDSSLYVELSPVTLDGTGYLAHLSDNTVDSETGRHIQNLKDSTIKSIIDEWYEKNVFNSSNEKLLEDTVWCNDRSVIDETYSIENYASGVNKTIFFGVLTRLYDNARPSLSCLRDMDKFTVDSSDGNGDLIYPIGLLTADELYLAGNTDSIYGNINYGYGGSYLGVYFDDEYWTMSPAYFNSVPEQSVYYINQYPLASSTNGKYGVRPSISLKNSTVLADGNGTFENPYILAY